MPLGELAEAGLRAVIDYLLRVIYYGVFLPIGFALLRLVTIGRYPPRDAPYNRELVALVPFALLLFGVTLWFS